MKKEQLIELVKEEISAHTNALTSENLKETSYNIRSQLDILCAIERAVFIDKSKDDQSENLVKDELNEPTETVSEDGNVITGFFQQNIRGGILHKKEQIYVPEKIIRELDLKAGDYVQATLQKHRFSTNNDGGRKRPEYHFEVLQRNKKEIEEVRSIQQMLTLKTHKDFGRLYIEFKDSPSSDIDVISLISDYDVSRFQLEEGDIIDYAYEPNNPISGKVIWKHKISEIALAEKSSKSSSKTGNDQNVSVPCIEPTLEGISVLTVGGTNMNLHKSAQEEITKRNGNFQFLSGDEQKPTIISKIKKSDIIIVFTQSISHDAMNLTKAVCKEYNKVCSYTKNVGGSSLVRMLSSMKKELSQAERDG